MSGGQELGRGPQAAQTLRDPWRTAARRYHCTVGMGLPAGHVVCLVNSIFTPPPTHLLPSPPQQVEQPLVPAHMHPEASQAAARMNLLMTKHMLPAPSHPKPLHSSVWDFSGIICLIFFSLSLVLYNYGMKSGIIAAKTASLLASEL